MKLSILALALSLSLSAPALAQNIPAPSFSFSNAWVQTVPMAFATLPTCNATYAGARTVVADAKDPAYLQPIVGGGTTEVGALCNGTAWVAD